GRRPQLAMACFIAPAYGCRTAFVASGVGPLLAGILVFALIDGIAPRGGGRLSLASLFPLHAWRRVLANRASAGYTAGYAAHCLELFGSRGWMVAYLAYAATVGASFPWAGSSIVAVVDLLAVPVTILRNEVDLP